MNPIKRHWLEASGTHRVVGHSASKVSLWIFFGVKCRHELTQLITELCKTIMRCLSNAAPVDVDSWGDKAFFYKRGLMRFYEGND